MLDTKVIKRDGRKVKFNKSKIEHAINEAMNCSKEKISNLDKFIEKVILYIQNLNQNEVSVEEIQKIIIYLLKSEGYDNIANIYDTYRMERTKNREMKSDLMKTIQKIGIATDRDNANVGNNFSSKLLRIASETNKINNLGNMPKNLAKLHEQGDLYFHDLDSYNLTINCLHIPTGSILKKGFNTGYGTINPPKRIETAAELSCILLQSSQNDMFGGQSHPNFDNDLSYYVELTRQEVISTYIDDIKKIGFEINLKDEEVKKNFEIQVENKVKSRIHQAMQSIVYNLNTMHSRAGSQVPFSSINLGIPKNKDAASICEIFLLEYEKGLGKGEQPIFPNIIFRVKDGINKKPSDPYFYLFKLACRVASKRMNPTFMNIDADFNKEYYDKGYMPSTMGCRTYLMSNINGEPGCEGRGNIAPTTINLPRIGLNTMLSLGDICSIYNIKKDSEEYKSIIKKEFFKLFEEKINLAKDSLLNRYSVLKNLKVKDLPFVIGQRLIKGSDGLSDDDSIEPVLKQGTWGIGFIGLAETLIALTGQHHGESDYSRELGIEIITFLREKCDTFTKKYKLNFSCYATPAEGLSGKFIKQDKKIFGEVKGITDKDYYTNSFHIPVKYPISIKKKIDIEAPYHKLCNGGHISYIEVDDTPTESLIMDIINYAYSKTNINYVGINFHMRYCKNCGEQVHNNELKCPKCGGTDIQGISRVTGYLSLDERFGEGKVAERKDRITHTNSHNNYYSKIPS